MHRREAEKTILVVIIATILLLTIRAYESII